MKVGAHPMVVAVALGLLGPAALEMRDDEHVPETVADWAELDAPSVADRDAVAAAWARLDHEG